MRYLLQHLLINSAARLPDGEALKMDGRALTYKQLDGLTNQVARTLQSAGVQRGDRVGIYLNKSMASVISVFGIMKAGATYVPLDANAPARRLAYITRDCNIKALLTSTARVKALADFFVEGTPLQTIVVTDEDAEFEVSFSKDVRVVTWPEVRSQNDGFIEDTGAIETDLAYILYTSGSTGMPKGVMISHRTIFTFVNWCLDTFQLTPEDRVTSHAPLHFDLSTFDIYASIGAGSAIVLLPETLSTLPSQLASLIQEEKVTITYLVPSILSLMVNYGNLGARDLSRLRLILFAGEVFPVKYLRRLMAAIPHTGYYNLYGPTETNVCTYYKVQADDVLAELGDQPIPIGQACENIEVFAVSDNNEVVTEPGQRGELWVRGSCVAQGYWGDPEKTARSFVQSLAPALADAGIELEVVGNSEMETFPGLRRPTIRYFNLRGDQSATAGFSEKIRRITLYYARLLKFAWHSDSSIFHILWPNKFVYFDRTLLNLYYRSLGKKLVFTAHNVNTEARDQRDSALNRLSLRIHYFLMEHIFVHTSESKDQLVREYGVQPGKVTVLTFPLNNVTPRTSISTAASRLRLGLPAGEKTILFFGNIASYKGLEDLIRALPQLRPLHPFRLLVAGNVKKGEESYLDQMRAIMRELNVSDVVDLRIEYIPEELVELYLKAAHLLVLPYRRIFQSGVLFLSYSFGLPVLASDAGSLREEIVEGETGFVFRRGDSGDLAEQIHRYFKSDLFSELDTRRKRIMDYARETYSWERLAATTLQVYGDLAGVAEVIKAI